MEIRRHGIAGEQIGEQIDFATSGHTMTVAVVGKVLGIARRHGNDRRILNQNAAEYGGFERCEKRLSFAR